MCTNRCIRFRERYLSVIGLDRIKGILQYDRDEDRIYVEDIETMNGENRYAKFGSIEESDKITIGSRLRLL